MINVGKKFQFVKSDDKEIVRLFCFHYAGGSPFFYADMYKYLQSNVGIYPYQLPGRGNRDNEKFAETLEVVAEEAAEEIRKFADKPIIFTGHSMGGMIAYQTAYFLQEKYGIKLEKMFLTGTVPQLGEIINRENMKIEELKDEEFCEMLLDFGAIDERTLRIREFHQIFLPIIKADFNIVESYKADSSKKICADIKVYGGTEDKIISVDKLEAWKKYTTGKLNVVLCKGNHFFIKEHKKELCNDINGYVQRRYEI